METTPTTALDVSRTWLSQAERERFKHEVWPHQETDAPEYQPAPTCLAPLLYFSSGARGLYVRENLIRAAHKRDYAHALRIIDVSRGSITEFEFHNLRWLLNGLLGRDNASTLFQLAMRSARSPADQSVLVENAAFFYLKNGDWEQAKRLCLDALKSAPPNQGLWANLLVAMNMGGEQDEIEELLLALPRQLDIEHGLLGLYLEHEPDFNRPVCNGG